MIAFLPSVRCEEYCAELWEVLFEIDQIRSDVSVAMGTATHATPWVITSMNDDTHGIKNNLGKEDPHYKDEGADGRSHDLADKEKVEILLRARIKYAGKNEGDEPRIGIIIENRNKLREHFHIQIGVKGLLKYW